MSKQSSPEMSSLAARVLSGSIKIKDLKADDIKSLCASVLSQDETSGDEVASLADSVPDKATRFYVMSAAAGLIRYGLWVAGDLPEHTHHPHMAQYLPSRDEARILADALQSKTNVVWTVVGIE